MGTLPASLWWQLRQAGIHSAQPVLLGRLRLQSGQRILIRGINSLALTTAAARYNKQTDHDVAMATPAATSAFGGLFQSALIDTKLYQELGMPNEAMAALQLVDATGSDPIPLYVRPQADLGPWLIMDIHLAQTLLVRQDRLTPAAQLSHIEIGPLTPEQKQSVDDLLENFQYQHADTSKS